jgi:2'-5' RNA ligase
VTLEIPESIRVDLDAARRDRGVLEEGGASHVTLLPPIEADDGVVASIIDHLDAIARRTAPIRVHLRGADTFRPVSPVVFLVLVDGAEQCTNLESAVRSGDLGVESRFLYHPHVTLAHGAPDDVLDRVQRDFADVEFEFTAAAMTLRENVDGVWNLVREFRLTG